MAETGTDFCVYYGLGYMRPEFRGQAMFAKIGPSIMEAISSQNGTCTDVTTVDKLVYQGKFIVGQGGYVSDYVPYTDQKLTVDGIPVFEKLAKFGGISMIVTGPGEDVTTAKI
jgi:hypothetical protein